MEKLENYSTERRFEVALQLIGAVFFAVCDGLGDNAAKRAISSLYEFSDICMADPACAELAESMADAQALTLLEAFPRSRGGTIPNSA
jgi:hypothetical protein